MVMWKLIRFRRPFEHNPVHRLLEGVDASLPHDRKPPKASVDQTRQRARAAFARAERFASSLNRIELSD